MQTWNEFEKELTAVTDVEKEALREKALLVSSLIRRRKMLNLTQAEVAIRAGLTQSAVARLENDATIPRMDTLQKVALALGLHLRFVLHDEEAATTTQPA